MADYYADRQAAIAEIAAKYNLDVTQSTISLAPTAYTPEQVAVSTPVSQGNVVTTELPAASKDKLEAATAMTNEQVAAGGLQAQAAAHVPVSEPPVDESNQSAAETKRLAKKAEDFGPFPNVLHNYATYTYGLTLFMLSKDEYETLQQTDSGVKAWDPKFALISSAGRYNKLADGVTPGRHAEFQDDFYFENFRMTTVIGLNNQTRGTNAIEFSFTIVEPYGMTLLDRMIEASKSPSIGSKNYLAQPYLIELDFFGATDLGGINAPMKDLTKRFPIQIIEFKIRASTKGAEYAVKAVPFSHGAFKDTAVTTPVNLEIEATTLGDFFNATATSRLVPDLAENKERIEKVANTSVNERNPSAIENRNKEVSKAKSASVSYSVANYNNALNEWFALLKTNGDIEEPDRVEFNFVGFPDSANILESSVNPPETPRKNLVMGAMDRNKAALDSSNSAAVASGPGRTFGIQAGSRIIDVINQVMNASEYISKQMVEADGKRKTFAENAYVDFYRIVPQIKELRYDKIRKRYATTTVYHIVYNQYYNSKHPAMPYANPTAAVKEYNYIYTGKNIDIIDFSIDFDVAYFTAVTALPNNVTAGNNKDAKTDADKKPYEEVVPDDEDEPAPRTIEVVSSGNGQDTGKVVTQKQAVVANAISSIYSNARGDMINLKLKIIGDPHFIKQDDLYVNPGQPGYSATALTANNSLAMDHSEIFCKVQFLTPTDMDEFTGGITENTKYAKSRFTGIYKILSVDSEFSRGQFVQTLTAVRMMKTKKITVGNSAEERKESTNDKIAEQNSSVPGTRPPNIAGAAGPGGIGVDKIPSELPTKLPDTGAGAGRGFTNPALVTPAEYKGVIPQAQLQSLDTNTLLSKVPQTPVDAAVQEGAAIRRAITGGH